jgi:uncharacterized RDD family membrane protein YckC
MSTLTCEKCGTALPEGASFCAQCGTSVSVAQLGPIRVQQSAPPVDGIPVPAQVAVPQVSVRYAGFWLRAVAFLIDMSILSLIFVLIASVYPDKLMVFPDVNAPPVLALPTFKWPGIVLLFLMMGFYYALFEASAWQATPGKRIMRLYVTDLTGRPLTLWHATLRYFARKLSDFTLLVGYILAGFTAKKQALHDLLAGCLVLRRP